MMKYGLNQDGRKVGPIDPTKVNDTGWTWFDTPSDRDAASLSKLSLATRKRQMLDELKQEYQASLSRGFNYDAGVFRADISERRQRLQELVAQINAYRNGDASSELPNGKNSINFEDESGSVHSLSASQIVEMGEAANNLIDSSEDNLASLKDSINNATSHSDLDAIDLSSGWSN